MPRPMRDVILVRVSKDEQAGPEHFSLEAQEQRCREYSQRTGGEVVNLFTEVQRSWVDEIEKRPVFQQALDYASDPRNQVDRFIVARGDRFARKKFVFFMADYILKAANVDLKSTTESFDNTPDGEIQKGFSALMAEAESARLSVRLRDSFAKKRQKGGWSGWEPYGYKREKGGLTVDESEMSGWRLAYRLAMEGAESFHEIARVLRAAGYRGRKGGKLQAQSIIRMLKHPAYAGLIQSDADGVPILIPGKHEAILSVAEWEQLQAVIARIPSKSRGCGRVMHHAVLSGILYCARCSQKFVCGGCGHPVKQPDSYYLAYICSSKKYYSECDQIGIRRDAMDDLAAAQLGQLRLPTDWRDRVTEKLHGLKPPGPTLEQIEREENNLARMFQEGYRTWEQFTAEWGVLKQRRLTAIPPAAPAVLEVGKMLEHGILDLWRHPDATRESRRKLALAVFERITIDAATSRDITVVEIKWMPEVLPLLDL